MFGVYDSKEYKQLLYAKEEQQYAQKRAYRQRQAQLADQARKDPEWLTSEHGSRSASFPPPQPHPDSDSGRGFHRQSQLERYRGGAAGAESGGGQLSDPRTERPPAPETRWFVQCAVVLWGPDQDSYSVEIGFSIPDNSSLWERMVPDVQEAIGYFSTAYDYRDVDVSGFHKAEL